MDDVNKILAILDSDTGIVTENYTNEVSKTSIKGETTTDGTAENFGNRSSKPTAHASPLRFSESKPGNRDEQPNYNFQRKNHQRFLETFFDEKSISKVDKEKNNHELSTNSFHIGDGLYDLEEGVENEITSLLSRLGYDEKVKFTSNGINLNSKIDTHLNTKSDTRLTSEPKGRDNVDPVQGNKTTLLNAEAYENRSSTDGEEDTLDIITSILQDKPSSSQSRADIDGPTEDAHVKDYHGNKTAKLLRSRSTSPKPSGSNVWENKSFWEQFPSDNHGTGEKSFLNKTIIEAIPNRLKGNFSNIQSIDTPILKNKTSQKQTSLNKAVRVPESSSDRGSLNSNHAETIFTPLGSSSNYQKPFTRLQPLANTNKAVRHSNRTEIVEILTKNGLGKTNPRTRLSLNPSSKPSSTKIDQGKSFHRVVPMQTADTSDCEFSDVFSNYSLISLTISRNFTSYGPVANMNRCVALCCETTVCNTAYMVDHDCYGVSCFHEDCQAVLVDPLRFNRRLVYVKRNRPRHNMGTYSCSIFH